MANAEHQTSDVGLLWSGSLAADQLEVQFRELDALPLAMKLAIARNWDERLAGKPEAVVLFDGALGAYLGHWSRDSTQLRLELGAMNYRQWLFCSGRIDEISRLFGASCVRRPLAVAALVHCADGRFVLQQRSRFVAECPDIAHVPAGHLDPDVHRRPDGTLCPGLAMRAELQEELGLEREQLGEGRVVGLMESRSNGKPELLFRFRVGLSSQELEEQARTGRDGFEYSRLMFPPVEPAAFANWLRHNPLTLAEPSIALLAVCGIYGEPGTASNWETR